MLFFFFGVTNDTVVA